MRNQDSYLYKFGPFCLDSAERLLLRHGKPFTLPDKAFEILLVLVENSGHLVEKEALMQQVWPDASVEDANLTVNMSHLRAALGDDQAKPRYIETIRGHGYRFIARVQRLTKDSAKQAMEQQTQAGLKARAEAVTLNRHAAVAPAVWSNNSSTALGLASTASRAKLEPVGGAVPLASEFYIERPTDEEFRSAIARQDSIVLVKGARQVGKTSLLARGLQQARALDARIVLTDFQNLNAAYLESVEKLLLTLAESMADQLELDVSPTRMWNPQLSPSSNFERYLRREVFGKISSPIVWGLDEVDRLFTCHFGSEIFGLFRSWHNKRALDPTGDWHRFTLAIAYATEAHLFITDLNQSPFNVGTRLLLEDFTYAEVAELNRRFGSPLRGHEEVARYFRLVGGQPYLVHRGLFEMAFHGIDLASLEAQADHDEGLFGDHLQRLLLSLSRDAELCDAVRGVLRGQPCPTLESFYRLRSAGLVSGNSMSDARPRCQLYAAYLERHLF